MKTLLKYLILLLICGQSIRCKAQYEINSSVWLDEYTLQQHVDQYLSNLLLSYDYYQQWNSEAHQFESAIPTLLTYAPFTSRDIKVDALELDYVKRNFLLQNKSFDVEMMDSVMKNSKMVYTTLISYDDQGRITSSLFRNYQHKPVGVRIEYDISYHDTDTSHIVKVAISWSDGLLVKKNSTSVLNYYFDKDKRLQQAYTTHQSGEENTTFENSYSYDPLGRLIRAERVPGSEVYRDRNYSYTITPFVMDSAQVDYNALRIPGIQHWLRSYPDSGLNIIAYQKFEPNRNAYVEYSYLVDSDQNRLLMLRPYPHYFGEHSDSGSIMRSYCSISNSQNLYDTVPYDPNYKPRYIGTFYSQCSVEERYTSPPGLVNAGSVEGYKRSEHVLPNGWKRITYQRGSDAPSRFAPGYPVSVRFDVPYDKHLILDANNVIRYIIDYDKFVKIDVVGE